MDTKGMEVRIMPDGRVSIDMEGFVGGECLDASKAIEEVLGAVEGDRVMKAEASAGPPSTARRTTGTDATATRFQRLGRG